MAACHPPALLPGRHCSTHVACGWHVGDVLLRYPLAFRIALPCLLIRAGQHCALLCVFRGAPLASFAGLNVRRVPARSARSKAPVRRHCAAARLIMRVADSAPRAAPQPSARRRRWTRRSRRARRRRSTPRRRRSTRRRRQARARCCFGSSIARPASKLSGFWQAAAGSGRPRGCALHVPLALMAAPRKEQGCASLSSCRGRLSACVGQPTPSHWC